MQLASSLSRQTLYLTAERVRITLFETATSNIARYTQPVAELGPLIPTKPYI
jgi:predicted SpoU family rRNA methylase